MNQWRAPYNRYINKRILKDATRPRETRNYTAILMIPINSTLKIVGAGDARRHLETGFRLTHIPPPSCPPNATTSLPNSDPPSILANCFPPTVHKFIFHVHFHAHSRPTISSAAFYLEGAISSRVRSFLSRGRKIHIRSIAGYFTRGIDEFNVARDRKIWRKRFAYDRWYFSIWSKRGGFELFRFFLSVA